MCRFLVTRIKTYDNKKVAKKVLQQRKIKVQYFVYKPNINQNLNINLKPPLIFWLNMKLEYQKNQENLFSLVFCNVRKVGQLLQERPMKGTQSKQTNYRACLFFIFVSDGKFDNLVGVRKRTDWNLPRITFIIQVLGPAKSSKFKPCFKWYLGIILYSEHLFRSKNLTNQKLLHMIWTTKIKMSDESAGRNENPEKVKFLFLLNIGVSVFTQDAPLNIKSEYCTWTLLLSSKLRIYVHSIRH